MRIFFFANWLSATLWLFVLVKWRITVPLSGGAYFMVKDEANVWQRFLISGLVGVMYSGFVSAVAAMLNKRKQHDA